MRRLILLLTAFAAVITCRQETCAAEVAQNGGRITGRVLSQSGEPLVGASVLVEALNTGDDTDRSGGFSLSLPAGRHMLKVFYLGYVPRNMEVTVKPGGTVSLKEIRLKPSEVSIDQVVVHGGFNRFSKKETETVARMPLKNMENAQVYNVIPRQLTQEQLVVDYNDILQNITGGNVSSSNNSSHQSMLRGFRTFNGLRNGMASYTMIAIDPANIESVEAIKGPAGTLFGNSNASLVTFGGVMNRVTKRPQDHFFGEAGFSAGSWGLGRFTVDLNTPLNDDRTALARINAAYHTENSFQDIGYQRNFLIAPSLSLRVNERLSLLFDAEIYRTTRFLPANFSYSASGVTFDNMKDLPLDYRTSLSGSDLDSKLGTSNFFAQADYKISEQWKSTTNYSYAMTEYYDAYRLYTVWQTDSTVMRGVMAQKPQRQIMTSLQQNFTGDFKIGRMRNRIVTGINYTYFKADLRYTSALPYDVVNINQQPFSDIQISELDQIIADNGGYTQQRNEEHNLGIYASDVLDVTDRLFAMASVRYDYYKSKGVHMNGKMTSDAYDQSSWSPKFGLVYQPWKEHLSLFANYTDGFSNQNGADYYGKGFKPQRARQWEGGVKLEAFDNRLSATLSYYDINVNNVLRQDTEHLGFSIQDGERSSKGFEAEIVANPLSGLNLLCGYGYNDSEYTRANANVEGKRPLGTPVHMANFWVSYRIPVGIMKGFGVGLGGNYASDSYLNDTNTFVLPAYFVLSSTVFYEKNKYRIGVKVGNLTDEKYWSYIGSPQKPRHFICNIVYKF